MRAWGLDPGWALPYKAGMDADWASARLLEIRTLMQRSAIYRRALGPIMLYLGILGLVASVAGALLRIETARGFGFYWLGVSGLGVLGAYFLARRQAELSARVRDAAQVENAHGLAAAFRAQ